MEVGLLQHITTRMGLPMLRDMPSVRQCVLIFDVYKIWRSAQIVTNLVPLHKITAGADVLCEPMMKFEN
jgi:hypothetical protein